MKKSIKYWITVSALMGIFIVLIILGIENGDLDLTRMESSTL